MHKKLTLAGLLLLLPASAFSFYMSPHVGADYKHWGLNPQIDYEDIFPPVNNAFDIYFGSRFNGYFGLDIGYEQTERRQHTNAFVGDGTEQPFAVPEIPGNASDVDFRLRAVRVDFNFYWEVLERFEIIFFAGFAYMEPKTHIRHLMNGNWVEYRNQSKNKAFGRIGIGAQYNILPCFAIKGLINSDPDKRIDYIAFDELDNAFNIQPYNTAISYSIGLVYSFSNPRRHPPPPPVDDFESF